MNQTDEAILSRNGEKHVELRGPCPASTVAVLDAISLANGTTRTELVNTILGDWAAKETRKASLVTRVLQGNPMLAEAAGNAGGR